MATYDLDGYDSPDTAQTPWEPEPFPGCWGSASTRPERLRQHPGSFGAEGSPELVYAAGEEKRQELAEDDDDATVATVGGYGAFAACCGQTRTESRALLVGLDLAGKTTMLYKLKTGKVMTTIPTIGFNIEQLAYLDVSLAMWDVGGLDKVRSLWRHYYRNTEALIFVVDSTDRDRLPEAKEALHSALADVELRDCSYLLVFANKQDLPGAAATGEVAEGLGLDELRGRSWHIQACCSISGEGLHDGLNWIVENLPRRGSPLEHGGSGF